MVGLSLMLVALLLAIIGDDLIDEATANTAAESAVDDWLGADTQFDVVSVQVRGTAVAVTILGPGDPPPPEDLATDMTDVLGHEADLTLRVVPEVTYEVSTDVNGVITDQSGP